ncbi:MAG: HD domain-containing protein [Thermodesulfobacteriota bacterium]|nr:HD domain-containing protein [Thermodesulfobacteriota bacterium]
MDIKILKEKILKDPTLSALSILAKEKMVPFFLVGGYIRDLLLGTPRLDYDFTLPQKASSFISTIEEALRIRFFKVGKEQMSATTYRIRKKEESIDITPFQGQTIEEDLQRRDFTINAIAFSLRDETFHWVQGAFEDIEEKRVRPVSPHSIDQDPLRMLRAIRYLSTLKGFTMDRRLKEDISLKKEWIKKMPGERIKMELDRILLSPRPNFGMSILYELGLLLTLFPELKGLENLGQNQHHHLNVLSHTLLMIDKISWAFEWVAQNRNPISLTQEDGLVLYYASLFHDLGKQDTYSQDEKGRVHFYHHESFSCKRAEAIMERLRFSNPTKNRILRLIQHHMRILNFSSETGESALKRLVNQMGEETPLLVLHTLADKEASRGILSVQIDEIVEGHCLRIMELFEEKEILYPPSLITGHDVMALGYSSGPKVGEILSFIRERQVEGEIRTREEALEALKERFKI